MYWAGHPQARIGKDQQTPAETIFSRPGFITTDGLYRISGSHSDVQTIKQEIDKVSSLYPVSLSLKNLTSGQLRDPVHHRERARPRQRPQALPEGASGACDSLGGGRSLSYQTSLCLEGWRAGENSDQLQSRINPDQNGSDPADNWKVSLEKSNLHVLESPLSLAGPQKATLQCILVHLAKVLFPPHNPHNLNVGPCSRIPLRWQNIRTRTGWERATLQLYLARQWYLFSSSFSIDSIKPIDFSYFLMQSYDKQCTLNTCVVWFIQKKS